MLEFAIVLPLVLMLALGIITSATAHNRRMQLTHAAREGARYGATLPLGQCAGSPSPCGTRNWAGVVQSVVVERSGGELRADQVCVALVTGTTPAPVGAGFTTKSDGSACMAEPTAGDPEYRVQVYVRRTGDTIDTFVYKFPITLTSQATSKFEQ